MANRYIFKLIIVTTLSAILPGVVFAQPADAREELNRRSDNPGTGHYPAIKEEDASLPDQVIYRPRDLDALGDLKLGIVAWGNGGCSFDGASSRFHLLELASHGYLVIAGGRILSGPGAPEREPPAEGEQSPRLHLSHCVRPLTGRWQKTSAPKVLTTVALILTRWRCPDSVVVVYR